MMAVCLIKTCFLPFFLDFQKRWRLEPFTETFKENEGGKRQMRISYIDNTLVEPPRTYLMVIKRMSTCEGIQRYYNHFSVKVINDDGLFCLLFDCLQHYVQLKLFIFFDTNVTIFRTLLPFLISQEY